MTEFLAAAFAFPTVVFTALLIFFSLYAVVTLLGGADIHWLDSLVGIDHVNDSVFEGALSSVGIGGVPLTIYGGVSSIYAWLLCFATMKFTGADMLAAQIGIGLGAGLVGLLAGALTVRPLRGFFRVEDGPRRDGLVGRICEVRSLRVDEHSGNAEIGGVIAEIRCFRQNSLTLGSKALVYDYEPKEGIYYVGPIDASVAEVDVALAARPQAES